MCCVTYLKALPDGAKKPLIASQDSGGTTSLICLCTAPWQLSNHKTALNALPKTTSKLITAALENLELTCLKVSQNPGKRQILSDRILPAMLEEVVVTSEIWKKLVNLLPLQ